MEALVGASRHRSDLTEPTACTAHFDAHHAHCGRGSAKLVYASYFSGHGPPTRVTRPLQADLKELRNFVTDIRQTGRQNDRQTTDEALHSK
ncbi:hypothetical protein V3C99_003110 [Haemonchus contortus]|uniref:Uncharacterized protein n=1 Tax=Haemonchus contortus TaxID=6289 RepID=A0A7I4Y7X8_HAECO